MNVDQYKKIREQMWSFIILGALVGSIFPLFAWMLAMSHYDMMYSPVNIFKVHLVRKSLFIVDLIPVLTGALTGIWYWYQERIAELKTIITNKTKVTYQTAQLAQQIGEGNLEVESSELVSSDQLGEAILKMRDNLKGKKLEEEKQTWIAKHKNTIAEILRTHTDVEKMGDAILLELCQAIDAIQGALYLAEEDNEGETELIMVSSYAYKRKKFIQSRFKLGEGLVGEACIEQQRIFRTEIPKDYMRVTSGILGDRLPTCLLVQPLIANEVLYGCVELSGFKKFTPLQLRLVHEISQIVAQTLLNLKAVTSERVKGKMQALSENSPDLIMRVDLDERFLYMNPVIEKYTGQTPDQFHNSAIYDAALPEEMIDTWSSLVKEVAQHNTIQCKEMVFQASSNGKHVMQVNAIPEFNESQELESVLIVSNDITQRKQNEWLIEDKNRKITESIAYAQRIQGSILPEVHKVRSVFEDSFIYYKAKDVVSGDFPWFYVKGEDVYVAAVDCTGHGVPGALMSIIGYFLLNEIISSANNLSPAAILDQLDASVRSTLKQDRSTTETRDGMDIALCKINKNTLYLEYAGAHRPLYHVHLSQLQEYEGDKAAIGGRLIKQQQEQQSFTNHTLQLQEGDAIYIFSDGITDQFGGPKTKKFGPRKVRSLVTAHHGVDMEHMQHLFEQAYESWRGEEKQIDDVLVIGMRF